MTLPLLILLALATSVVSGVLGMAGGLVLMGACTMTLPIADAMILHGATQVTANGSRTLVLWRHVRWRVVMAHGSGALVAWLLMRLARLHPDPALVLLTLGIVPFVALLLPRSRWLDASRPTSAALCGLLTNAMQLVAGVAGPLLDVFYVNTTLDRREVVATKAATQAIAHASKIAFYAPMLGYDTSLGPGWLMLAGLVAIVGTSLGTRLLERWSDVGFRQATRWIVLGLGATFLARGVAALAG